MKTIKDLFVCVMMISGIVSSAVGQTFPGGTEMEIENNTGCDFGYSISFDGASSCGGCQGSPVQGTVNMNSTTCANNAGCGTEAYFIRITQTGSPYQSITINCPSSFPTSVSFSSANNCAPGPDTRLRWETRTYAIIENY